MTYDELMINVRNKLPSRVAITAIWIQQRYRVLQSQARRCIADLQEQGLVGKDWDPCLGGYPILLLAQEAEKQ
jgi:ribosomal protein S25